MQYDLKIINGNILTEDGFIDSIGIKDGKITSLHPKQNESYKDLYDLDGKYVIPGFFDAHTHMLISGLQEIRLNLENVTDINKVIEIVYKRSLYTKEKIIIGYGWDESLWKNHEYIKKNDLDVTNLPVILFRKDLHMASLNTAALKLLNIDSKDGIINEELLRKIDYLTLPSEEEIINALNISIKKALSLGITSLRDIVDLKTYNAYKKIKTSLNIYKALYDNFYFEGFGKNNRDAGIKIFMDGSIGAKTAAHEDYKNLKMTSNQLYNLSKKYWDINIPVVVHAIGEIAIKETLFALLKSPQYIRNSIEHFELIEDPLIDMINDNTIISAQPNYLQWASPSGLYEHELGKEWLYKNNSFRSILDAKKHLAFGSDSMPMNPFYGINFAINSKYPNQKINIYEAINAYTNGSAYVLNKENSVGKIDINYDADFIVLNENIFKLNNISNIKPLRTYIKGRLVYEK